MGNTEERNLLRGPLPLMECAADAKAPYYGAQAPADSNVPSADFFFLLPHRQVMARD
ncbi:hypothetical protein LI020_13615 [[Clostridium] symbiosum]|uniref:hypothetical protein n=1 Tax=Clostridium symbiosum TaxID=1512 RepID=UPI001D08A2DD|nr:hypothetical protein [[Clostridium] symbiosum]MCB6608600.1 hypothetical protein [[Clostridium] symbiosum]MCB6931708.1 hypothetical protein [[Clostridium] symbiosum]